MEVKIVPSPYGRGFYIHNCPGTIGDIAYEFIDYRDEIMKFEDPWIVDNDYYGCKVNRMRGVKYMTIQIRTQKGEEPKGGFIYIA